MPSAFEIQTPEMQNLIGKMPGWIVRRGIGLMLLLLLLFISASFFISYNDSITVPVAVTGAKEQGSAPETVATVPLGQFGRIQPGQQVLISLTAYPSTDFGYLPGVVDSLAPLNSDKKGYVHISLPQKLRTLRQVNIPGHPVLAGTAEIILQKRSLFSRIFSFR